MTSCLTKKKNSIGKSLAWGGCGLDQMIETQKTKEWKTEQNRTTTAAFTLGINMWPVSWCCPHTHWNELYSYSACPGPEVLENALRSDVNAIHRVCICRWTDVTQNPAPSLANFPKRYGEHLCGVLVRLLLLFLICKMSRSWKCFSKETPPLQVEACTRAFSADAFKYCAGETDPIGYPDRNVSWCCQVWMCHVLIDWWSDLLV